MLNNSCPAWAKLSLTSPRKRLASHNYRGERTVQQSVHDTFDHQYCRSDGTYPQQVHPFTRHAVRDSFARFSGQSPVFPGPSRIYSICLAGVVWCSITPYCPLPHTKRSPLTSTTTKHGFSESAAGDRTHEIGRIAAGDLPMVQRVSH